MGSLVRSSEEHRLTDKKEIHLKAVCVFISMLICYILTLVIFFGSIQTLIQYGLKTPFPSLSLCVLAQNADLDISITLTVNHTEWYLEEFSKCVGVILHVNLPKKSSECKKIWHLSKIFSKNLLIYAYWIGPLNGVDEQTLVMTSLWRQGILIEKAPLFHWQSVCTPSLLFRNELYSFNFKYAFFQKQNGVFALTNTECH